jgi:hypothetical protein
MSKKSFDELVCSGRGYFWEEHRYEEMYSCRRKTCIDVEVGKYI